MIDHLDRITNLGFNVDLTWNKNIEIIYDLEGKFSTKPNAFDIRVLFCGFDIFSEPTFEDIVETCSDFFYMWYNRNIEILRDYEFDDSDVKKFDKLVDSCLGDITTQVYRDFNIDTLLD
jgi:hypothetical protein